MNLKHLGSQARQHGAPTIGKCLQQLLNRTMIVSFNSNTADFDPAIVGSSIPTSSANLSVRELKARGKLTDSKPVLKWFDSTHRCQLSGLTVHELPDPHVTFLLLTTRKGGLFPSKTPQNTLEIASKIAKNDLKSKKTLKAALTLKLKK
ncbi:MULTISPECIES: hypothetical protein [Paenibacillus]|uniref:hypothetical protein n=1 Tax=Paenibacillus TaxID=44249 RepID=UPI001BCE31B7|nr:MULTISPECIES: hypothetical protein [Paenibacillus]